MRRTATSFRKRRDGSSAVEFAMVAAPFFFMLFAIMELGLVFITDSILESAVTETGRLVRTGQAHAEGMDKARFKEEVCSRMSIFAGDCDERAFVDVREVASFAAAAPPDPMSDGIAFDEAKTGYGIGGPRSIILVTVWYEQPLVTPFMKKALASLEDGPMMMISTTTFRNEPFGT